MLPYVDRRAAGRDLAANLACFAGRDDVTVMALPRGGIPVGLEVATALGAPLDVFLLRKVHAPDSDEVIATVAGDGTCTIDPAATRMAGFDLAKVDALVARTARELRREETRYRGTTARRDLAGRTIILVYDGMVTGASMRAAVVALRAYRPARIIVAVPVGSANARENVERVADACICLATPEPYFRTSVWYQDFTRVEESDALTMLETAALTLDTAA